MPLQRIITNAIEDNTVNIAKLDVTDGTAGQVLSTDGNGVLSFIDAGTGSGVTGCDDVNTILLIQSDTTNGSTTFVDTSQFARTITREGNVTHTTTPAAEIGSSSINFPGSGNSRLDAAVDFLTLAHDAEWNFPNGAATIEFWMNSPLVSAFSGANGKAILSHNPIGGDPVLGWEFYMNQNGNIQFLGSNDGTQSTLTGTTNIGDNEWHHIALTWNNPTLTLWVDGISEDTFTDSSPFGNLDTLLKIGVAASITGDYDGQLDEIRFSDVARYSVNFTPQATTFCPGGDSSGDFPNNGAATTASERGSVASYTSGGEINTSGAVTATKEKYTYASGLNISITGELLFAGTYTSCQSETHGYAGSYGAGANHGKISKFSFSNDNDNSITVADMHQDHSNGTTAHSSETHGYWAGGFPPSDGGSGVRISKFLFASESTTSSHGTLQSTHGAGVAGASNFATGGFVWGNFPNNQSVDRFSFASDNNSTTHTQLAQAQRDQTGQSGELFAYSVSGVFGGSPASFLSTISKFSYTSDSFQADIATCSIHQLASGTASISDNGYTIGGIDNFTKSDKVRTNSHASDGNESDVTTLTAARSHFGGCGSCD